MKKKNAEAPKIHKTVFSKGFKICKEDEEYYYQTNLTSKLIKGSKLIDQSVINEIVLWKVNRYAEIDADTLKLLNKIDRKATTLNIDEARKILKALIQNKGIQLPMASTILRFRNKNIYQIIDQRVYRIIYKDNELKLKTHPNEKNLNYQIDAYFQYLKDLKAVCKKLKIPFEESDRILFMADKRINKNVPLNNYSTRIKE